MKKEKVIEGKDTPSADTIYRIIKRFNIHSLHDKYKEFIKEKYGRKVKGKKYYVIVDETEWGYYGRYALRNSWIWGYKRRRGTTGSFLFLSFMIVVSKVLVRGFG